MTDHANAESRMAPLVVCEEQPDWRLELLTALCAALAIGFIFLLTNVMTLSEELLATASERDMWIERSLVEDKRPMVRLEYDGRRFTCRHFNVRHEWQVAVAAECNVLGELLRLAARPQ